MSDQAAWLAILCAEHIHHLGINALEAEDHRLCLKCVYEAYRPLETAAQVCLAPLFWLI